MNHIKTLLKKLPSIKGLYRFLRFMRLMVTTYRKNLRFLTFQPPGHFYSPIPDIKEVLKQNDRFAPSQIKTCIGVELNESRQLDLLNQLAEYSREWPYNDGEQQNLRYYNPNRFFAPGDAMVLYSIIRQYQPQRVIEIGSGLSSGLMMDVNEMNFAHSIDITLIEPYPTVLHSTLKKDDMEKCTIVEKQVQDVPLDVFQTLSENDILFIDSSHVMKFGSDVNYLYFEVLPSIHKGVLVHIHDIFWPFEYPREWFLDGRAWNEAYLLRAFLQFNNMFEILWFNSFMAHQHADEVKEKLLLSSKETDCSIWLMKTEHT